MAASQAAPAPPPVTAYPGLANPEAFRHLFPYEARTLAVGGGTLAYVDEGPRDAAPILCVHGNPSWSFLYRHVLGAFAGEHRVVAPDHIGCGRSDKPQGWTYRVADHVANLEKLVLELDLTDITLVVHDWGGAIGMGVAGRHPERFSRFVVANTAAFCLPVIPRRIAVCKWPVFGDVAIRGFNAFAWAATSQAVARPMAPDVKAGFLAPYHDWASRIATLRFVQDIPMGPSHTSWETMQTIDANLAKLTGKPMQIFWGMQDWCFTPAFLEGWIQRFPEATVERYEDASHYMWEDAHERAIPRMAAFLAEHGGGGGGS